MSAADDLALARALLEGEGHAVVIVRAGVVLGAGHRRGVADLIALAEALGPAAQGAAVADRVVGRAAALVYCALGVAAVYAQRLSDAGAAALDASGVACTWGARVPAILNRTRDGLCPFEQAAAAVDDPAQALPALRARLAALSA